MAENEELWRPVPGYAGWYEVSNLGNVQSLPRATTTGKLLKPHLTTKNYRQVGLSKYGRTKLRMVSHLVLEAFRGPRPPDHQACHGPGGRQDDRLVNLYWGTASQNQLDRRRDGTSNQGARSATARLTEAKVLELRRRYAEGETMTALAAETGVSQGAVNSAVHGRTWAHLTEGIPDPEIDGRSLISTPGMRERRREYGKRGAAKRWGKTC